MMVPTPTSERLNDGVLRTVALKPHTLTLTGCLALSPLTSWNSHFLFCKEGSCRISLAGCVLCTEGSSLGEISITVLKIPAGSS